MREKEIKSNKLVTIVKKKIYDPASFLLSFFLMRLKQQRNERIHYFHIGIRL